MRKAKRPPSAWKTILSKDEDVVNYTAYIGGGTPRFFLLIVQQLANTNLAEFVVMTKDNAARERVMQRIRLAFATDFPELRGRVMRLNVGPPMDYPLVFRVFGEDPEDRSEHCRPGDRDHARQSQHRGCERRLA